MTDCSSVGGGVQNGREQQDKDEAPSLQCLGQQTELLLFTSPGYLSQLFTPQPLLGSGLVTFKRHSQKSTQHQE